MEQVVALVVVVVVEGIVHDTSLLGPPYRSHHHFLTHFPTLSSPHGRPRLPRPRPEYPRPRTTPVDQLLSNCTREIWPRKSECLPTRQRASHRFRALLVTFLTYPTTFRHSATVFHHFMVAGAHTHSGSARNRCHTRIKSMKNSQISNPSFVNNEGYETRQPANQPYRKRDRPPPLQYF